MTVPFAKSLDRPVDVFGIKGRWLGIFIAMAGSSIVFSLVVGACTSSGIAICTAILLVTGSFVFCLTTQGKVPARQVSKYKASAKIYPYVNRHESVSRILTVSKASGYSWFANAHLKEGHRPVEQVGQGSCVNKEDLK